MQKKSPLPALYVGRFQPFHMGHLDALNQIFSKEKNIIIGIGSSQEEFTKFNPFTKNERLKMIEAVLKEENFLDKIQKIIFIPDINNHSLWVKHINDLCPPFGTVYSGSAIVKKLFAKDGGHKVVNLKKNNKISATIVRQLIKSNKDWRTLVPSSVAELLVQWDASSRLKLIYGN